MVALTKNIMQYNPDLHIAVLSAWGDMIIHRQGLIL
jgi:hypothetical protein